MRSFQLLVSKPIANNTQLLERGNIPCSTLDPEDNIFGDLSHTSQVSIRNAVSNQKVLIVLFIVVVVAVG